MADKHSQYSLYCHGKIYKVLDLAHILKKMRENEDEKTAILREMKHFKTVCDNLVELEKDGMVRMKLVGNPNAPTEEKLVLNLCKVFQKEFPDEWGKLEG